MSQKHSLHDGTGILNVLRGIGILDIIASAAPTDGVAGYAVGCLWRNRSGTAGLILYINNGSNTSANWVAIA